MNKSDVEKLTLPSDPAKQKQFKIMLNECLSSIHKQESEREAYKDIVEEITKQFALPSKVINKLIKALHNQNFTDIRSEHELLDYLHDMVVQ